MGLGESGAEPRPSAWGRGGARRLRGALAPGHILVPVPPPVALLAEARGPRIFRKAFRVKSRPPGRPGGPRQCPGLREDALWGAHTPAPRDLDCACGWPGLESALNGRGAAQRHHSGSLRGEPGRPHAPPPAASPCCSAPARLPRECPQRRGTQHHSRSRSGCPPQGGFWARAGSRGRHGRGTLPLHRLPKLGPRACPPARPRASLTTGTHAFSSGPMIVAWWKSNICHPPLPQKASHRFSQILFLHRPRRPARYSDPWSGRKRCRFWNAHPLHRGAINMQP